MSRKSIETRLNTLEYSERVNRTVAVYGLGIAALSGVLAYSESGFRPIGVGLGIFNSLVAVDAIIRSTSYSKQAAVLHGVLAQDELCQADPEPGLTEVQAPQFIDQDNDTNGLFKQ